MCSVSAIYATAGSTNGWLAEGACAARVAAVLAAGGSSKHDMAVANAATNKAMTRLRQVERTSEYKEASGCGHMVRTREKYRMLSNQIV